MRDDGSPEHSLADIRRVQAGLPARRTRHVYHKINYRPRAWAKRYHASWCRAACLVLHRRAGKTTSFGAQLVRGASNDRWEAERLLRTIDKPVTKRELKELLEARTYWHIYPSYKQAELTAWPLLKRHVEGMYGVRVLEQRLRVTFPGGHKVQLIGADDPDSLRGPALSGVVYDEYSQQPQNIHGEIISKALGDHLGFYAFGGTIKGTDHLYKTHEAAKRNQGKWFSLWQAVAASLATESGITIRLLEQAMAEDREQIKEGLMTQADYDQEWDLSIDAAIKGGWFTKELQKARTEGRITQVPYDPDYPVETCWDLGVRDPMCLWFYQVIGRQPRVIDFYAGTDEGMPHYAKVLQDKGYVYARHLGPHDINVREVGTGKTRIETARRLGLRPFKRVKDIGFINGIGATRVFINRAVFDEEKCKVGLNALRWYRKQFNRQMNEFTDTPVHDWASHPADSLRTGAVGIKFPESVDDGEQKDEPEFPTGRMEREHGWMS